MVRNFGSVVTGLVVGSLINMAIIMLNTSVLFPMPDGADLGDPDQLTAYVATLPVAALLIVIVAHLGQAFVGGWVAARLGTRPRLLAMIVGVVTLAGGVASMMRIPAPAWMAVELPLYLVVAWAAGSLEVRRRAQPSRRVS